MRPWIVGSALVGALVSAAPSARACPVPWCKVIGDDVLPPSPTLYLVDCEHSDVDVRVDGVAVPVRLAPERKPGSGERRALAIDARRGTVEVFVDRELRYEGRIVESRRSGRGAAALGGLALAAVVAILRWRRRGVAAVP